MFGSRCAVGGSPLAGTGGRRTTYGASLAPHPDEFACATRRTGVRAAMVDAAAVPLRRRLMALSVALERPIAGRRTHGPQRDRVPAPVRDKPLSTRCGALCTLGRGALVEAPPWRPGVIDMHRGHKLTDPAALDLPEGFDPSGVPCGDEGHPKRRASSHRRHQRALPGLAPASMIATVEEAAAERDGAWLIWGSVGDRPVLFDVEACAAAELMGALASG